MGHFSRGFHIVRVIPAISARRSRKLAGDDRNQMHPYLLYMEKAKLDQTHGELISRVLPKVYRLRPYCLPFADDCRGTSGFLPRYMILLVTELPSGVRPRIVVCFLLPFVD